MAYACFNLFALHLDAYAIIWYTYHTCPLSYLMRGRYRACPYLRTLNNTAVAPSGHTYDDNGGVRFSGKNDVRRINSTTRVAH